jgi:outer membrane usher protein
VLIAFGWAAVNPDKPPDFMIKHLSGPLISVDTLKKIIVVEEDFIEYPVVIDSAALVLGWTGQIPLANLRLNDSISVEYRKYADNRRIAIQAVQKTASIDNQAQPLPERAPKVPIYRHPSSQERDTVGQFKAPQAIEASKTEMEKTLSLKTREQLYREIFHTSPPKRPKRVEASLVVNEITDGIMEIDFTDDHLDFAMPVLPILRILSKIAIPDLLNKLKTAVDSTGRIMKSALAGMGLQTTFDNEMYQVKILVPPIFLLKQVHQLSGLMQDPYAVETIKPNAVSAYCNIQADQQFKYFENLSSSSSNVETQMIETENRNVRQPFSTNLDGAINAKNVVLEGMANYLENSNHPMEREDVRLLYDLQESALRFSVGDIQYLTLGYQANVRMGGVSISKDLSLQPYVLTYPIGEHEFYLTDPAEAEIWVNDVMVNRMTLEAGTHDVRGFPFSTGNNHVKIILKDFSGRRDSIDFSTQYNTTLLVKGFSRYSFNVGVPSKLEQRRYTYDEDEPSFSLAYQRGISNRLTLDFYSQAFTTKVNTRTFYNSVDTNTFFSKGYKFSHSREGMLGFGGLYATPLGFMDWDAAVSYVKNRGPGSALRLGYTYTTSVSYKNSEQKQSAVFRLNTPLTWNTQIEYLSPKFLRSPVDSPYNYLEALKFSTDLNAPLSEQFTISAGGRYYVRRDTANLFELSIRLQKTWLKNLNTSLAFQYTTDIYGSEANPEVIASVQWLFRSKKNEFNLNEEIRRHPPDNVVQTTTPSQTAQTSQTTQATQSSEPQWDFNTGFQWNYDDFTPRPEKVLAYANALLGPQYNDFNALVGYTGNQGTVQLTQDMEQPEYSGANYLQHKTDLGLKTALVYAGKTVCLSRPLYSGGFVLANGVKNLADNKILVNPSDQGYEATSNFFGPAVLPLYAPYQLKRIRVEPENPPMGFVNEKSSFTLFPQYKSGFCLNIGSEKSVLVLGTLRDFDNSAFAYQTINIAAVDDKNAATVTTFTNGVGRFQFLGHENKTYKIMPPPSWDRLPITFKIPKNTSGFYHTGIMTFVNLSSTTNADTGKADTAQQDTAKSDTTKKDAVKTDTTKADTSKPLNMNADSNNVPWISVLGSLAVQNGRALGSTKILIGFLDSAETPPLNRIFYPNSVTNEQGVFQFVCSKTGRYKITVTSGNHKDASLFFAIPPGTKHSFNIGSLRLK